MSRHPIVLSSLEEDFKRLGLLAEDDQMKAAPSGEPATNKASKSRNVGAMTDEPSNTGEDPTVDMPGAPHGGKKSKTNPAGPEAKPFKVEAIKGMPDKRRAVEAADADDDDDDDSDDDDKEKAKKDDDKDESVDLAGANSVNEKVGKLRGRQDEGKSYDRVSKLIENVNEIMESLDNSRRNESVKAFANVSIIAEMLRRGFANFAESTEDGELGEASEALGLLAEEAAEIARAIEAEEDLDGEKVEEEFRSQMDALLNGLDFYSSLMESTDEDGEPVEEEEQVEASDDDDDDDDDDSDDDDSDDDDDDDKDDKKPAFLKKGKDEGRLPGSVLVKKTKGASSGAGSAVKNTPGMRLNMSRQSEAYMPFGKKAMVNRPGKAGRPTAAKESKK